MNAPPSLPSAITARAFAAGNGELGILRDDVGEFLAACERDQVAILGGEAWLADHKAAFSGDPLPSTGQWCGLMPVLSSAHPGVFTFDVAPQGDRESWKEFVQRSVKETHFALLSFNPDRELSSEWRPHFRLTFLLQANA